MPLRELRDHQLSSTTDSSTPREEKGEVVESSASGKHFTTFDSINGRTNRTNQKVHDYESTYNSCSPVHMITAKSFYTGSSLQNSLHRATADFSTS